MYLISKSLSTGKKALLWVCIAAFIFLTFSYSAQNENPISAPPHLLFARNLLSNVSPENNSYRHRPSTVRIKGINGAASYECHTDCSGLIDALFHYSYGYTEKDFERWLRKRRALSSSYFRAINNQRGFMRITHIQNILPGDLLSYKLPPGSRNFGHVMIVDELPRHLTGETAPVIEGTIQWAVPIIDCTGKGHGITDSRHLKKDLFHSGIGKGEFRLYTNAEGLIVGFSWSLSPTTKFYDNQSRPLVVGRLIPGFRP